MYSWWDYRAGDFHQGRGLRIDLVLGTGARRSSALEWCIVDRNARKGTSPSDHAPVIVDLPRTSAREPSYVRHRRTSGRDAPPDPRVEVPPRVERLLDRVIDELGARSTADARCVRAGA